MSNLDQTLAVLDQISGLCSALRVGGPDPTDLQGLSDALTEATELAIQEWHRLSGLPDAAAPSGQYPSDSDIYSWFQGSTIAHHIDPDGAYIAKRAGFIAERACDWATAQQREKDARICRKMAQERNGWATQALRNGFELAANECAAAIRTQATGGGQ